MAQFKVRYFRNGQWLTLSDIYESYNRAATIATALENRGMKTSIDDIRDLPDISSC